MSESSESPRSSEPTANDTSSRVEITQPQEAVPQTSAPLAKSRNRRGIRVQITILVVIIILAAVGFGGYRYAVQQYNQLSALGAQMCDSLEAHNYNALYQHFSDNLKSQFTRAEFIHYGAELDQVEGGVLSCGQTAGNHFSVDAGQHAITVASYVSRDGTGTHTGSVRFQFTGNSWTVDGFDAGFLGVSLGALKALDTYCGALLARDYRTSYQLMASSLHSEREQQFLQDAFLHQQIDGIVLKCSLAGIGKTNTGSTATLTVDIQRVIYDFSGTMTFGSTSSGRWLLTSFDPKLQGRDIAPVAVVTSWCSDIKSRNYTDAFGLLTSQAQHGYSVNALAAQYSGKNGGVQWLDCNVDPTTYEGDNTGVNMVAELQHPGPTVVPGMPDHAYFVLLPQNGAWRITLLFVCASSRCGALSGGL